MARGKVDYLYKKPDSQMWKLKLQYPASMGENGKPKTVTQSMGTADRATAEMIALPLITQYRLELWEHQNTRDKRKRRLKVESIDTIYPIGESTWPAP